ncbi:MAG: carbohydrate ABC transporter permease [Chloroflexi bacterium]|nr:carbohydrate ABC transporter permease [Chloroflexota bacterium]
MASTSIAVPQSNQGPKLVVRIVSIAALLFLVLIALVQIMPFVFTVANSFKCLPAIQEAPMAIIPLPPIDPACRAENGNMLPGSATASGATFNPSFEGYRAIFGRDFGRWTLNTAFLSVIVTVLRLGFDSLAGYALARLKFPGNRAVFFLILGTMMIPGVVLLIPRFIILKQLGMLNSFTGIIIPLMVDAFGIFLMKQFFESIPGEIEEAAQVDGADRFTIFFRIVLPMATPALTALAIFSFQGMWNNFLDVLLVLQGNASLWTLPLGLALIRGTSGETLDWNIFLAGSVITTLPLALVFFVFQRYFVEGVSYSGLKG